MSLLLSISPSTDETLTTCMNNFIYYKNIEQKKPDANIDWTLLELLYRKDPSACWLVHCFIETTYKKSNKTFVGVLLKKSYMDYQKYVNKYGLKSIGRNTYLQYIKALYCNTAIEKTHAGIKIFFNFQT